MGFSIGMWAERTVTRATATFASAVVTSLTVTLPGCQIGDVIIPHAPSSLSVDLVPISASVTAENTIAFQVRNLGAATAVTTGSQIWGVLVLRGDQSAIPNL